MTLTSEVGNIMTGMIEVRDGHMKAIGVATTNLTPGPTGEVPLSKQGAFQYETVEGMRAAEQPSAETQPAYEETLDLGVQPAMPAFQQTVGEAQVKDVIGEDPIKVADPSGLGGFNFQGPAVTDTPFDVPATEPVKDPMAEDISMPVMPDIVGGEPETVNSALFAGGQNTIESATIPVEQQVAIENPLDAMGNLDNGLLDGTVNSQEAQSAANFEVTKPEQLLSNRENATDMNDSFKAADVGTLRQAAVPKFDFDVLKERIIGTIDQYRQECEDTFVKEDTDDMTAEAALSALPELSTGIQEAQPQTVSEVVPETTMAPAPEPDGLMMDALSQISDIGNGPIDNSQIQGGRFMQN